MISKLISESVIRESLSLVDWEVVSLYVIPIHMAAHPIASRAQLSIIPPLFYVVKQQIGTLRHTHTAECEELSKTIHKQCLGEMIWEALKHWERPGVFICSFTSIYIVNFLYWKNCQEIHHECLSFLWQNSFHIDRWSAQFANTKRRNLWFV